MRFPDGQQAVRSYLQIQIIFSFGLFYYLSCTFAQSFEFKRIAYTCILPASLHLKCNVGGGRFADLFIIFSPGGLCQIFVALMCNCATIVGECGFVW